MSHQQLILCGIMYKHVVLIDFNPHPLSCISCNISFVVSILRPIPIVASTTSADLFQTSPNAFAHGASAEVYKCLWHGQMVALKQIRINPQADQVSWLKLSKLLDFIAERLHPCCPSSSAGFESRHIFKPNRSEEQRC